MEGVIMLIIRVSTLHISNGIIGAKAGECVNVGVCVVASEVAVVKP